MPNIYLPPVTQIPSWLYIFLITRSLQAEITCGIDPDLPIANTYIVGMAVRLVVPIEYGMYQANNLVGTIMAITPIGPVSTFTLNIDSTNFDDYIPVPLGNVTRPASLSPAGSINYQYTNGSSLSVPFQSLNNRGN